MSLKAPAKKSRLLPLCMESLESRHLLAADLIAISPAADSQFVNPASEIVLTFADTVAIGSGNVTIKAGTAVVETIDVNSASVQLSGGVVTINPANDLPLAANLTIEVDAGAFVSQSVPIFSEDFEGVELIPFEFESDGIDDDTDWSEELPDGWVKDNTDTPEGEPFEFFGFTIFDKESYIAAAEDQGRSNFTLGQGNIVVADGDEYDDGTDIDPNLFNVFLTTPEISLDGVAAGEAKLVFDSSFRPYPTQTGLVDVSFDDGATWENLLTLNDDTVEGGTSSLARSNTKEILPLNNPAGGTALVRFGMVEAGNDWWWAIDNVSVEIPGVGEASDGTSWSFTTAPGLSPAQNATGVSGTTNLQITFDAEVKLTPGLGDVEIRRADDGSIVEVIAVASDRVTASGNVVTIDPVTNLDADVEYYVTVDDFSIWDTEDVAISGITLFQEDFEGLELLDSGLVGGLDIDNYVMVVTGVLDVKTAGTYTFGVNSDDGQRLAIDVDQDGLDLLDDELIYDDTTHGTEVRLTTCQFVDETLQSCEGEGDEGIELAVGEYPFEYWYFEGGGGSSGEFFYAPDTFEAFDSAEFVLVGDDSKGIGVTDAGITATIYVSALEDATLDTIIDFERAELLVEGEITNAEGFPASAQIPTADIWSTGGLGLFGDNHPLPGFELPEPEKEWTPEVPEGWTTEENIPAGGAPEFEGWVLQSKEFWIAQQGDQLGRTQFTKGEGTVVVSDPDATDDFVEIDPLLYQDVFLITPEIPLSGLEPNKVQLEFDSSFAPYDTMTGLVDVSFDGGNSWDNLLTIVGTGADGDFPNSSTDRLNETIVLDVDNPSSGSAMFRWGMDEADNDWWWVIDNVRVTAPFSGNPIPGIAASDWSFSTGGGGETLGGDIDGNGKVEFADFLILSGNFGNEVDPGTNGDIDGNGKVEFADFLVLSGNFGKSIGEAAPASDNAATTDSVFAAAAQDDADDDHESDGLEWIIE